MEDFIYIILIVVWLLVSFLKKKPKKDTAKPAKPREATGSPEETSMEDMLEDFFGGGKKKKEEKPAYEASDRREARKSKEDRDEKKRWDSRSREDHRRYEPEPEYQEHAGEEAVSDDYEFEAEGKVETIDDLIESHKRQEAIRLANEEEWSDSGSPEDIPEFDLRTAVIFSEILNRKYS